MSIEYNNGNRKLLAVNIYMPCDDRSTNKINYSANYDEFIKYLGMMHAIIQDCDITSVYIIGDWNAGFNGNSVFGTELSSFCLEHGYVLSDIDHHGADSGSFTFVSEAHGTTSWIDHCLCTYYSSACQFTVFCPGLKKGMVLLEEKGHFCSRNYILRALSRA